MTTLICKKGFITRRGYKRKGYTKKNGTKVKSVYIKPMCVKGSGKKIRSKNPRLRSKAKAKANRIPPLKKEN